MGAEYPFDEVASNIFFPIYPVIAGDIIHLYGKKHGHCLDLGCGGGHLGLNVAKLSDMDVTLVDIKEEAINIATKRATDWGLESRSTAIAADVHHLPLKDDFYDVIVSRGSVGFWGDADEVKQAFSEIYRVLKIGGMTYIGRGFGNEQLHQKINIKMKEHDPEWPENLKEITNNFNAEDYSNILNTMSIKYDIIDDERGMWIVIKK
jgi:ubiquinone/menaquinone biosynthesis C-methylase UbiE